MLNFRVTCFTYEPSQCTTVHAVVLYDTLGLEVTGIKYSVWQDIPDKLFVEVTEDYREDPTTHEAITELILHKLEQQGGRCKETCAG